MKTQPTAFYVCPCCYLAINGYPDQCDPADHADPGSALPTNLSYFDWTYDESDPESADLIVRDGGTGRDIFSWDPCEGCGDRRGGERYRIAGFPK